MSDYEITFIINAITDDHADDLLDTFDCIVGHGHHGQDFITLTMAGDDASSALQSACSALAAAGVHVRRAEPDLVTRAEIAERLDLTPQAVGLYVRGERLRGSFPAPFHDAAGGLWLWGDIVEWFRAVKGSDPAHELSFPQRADYDAFNARLERQHATGTAPAVGTYRVQLSSDWAPDLKILHMAFPPPEEGLQFGPVVSSDDLEGVHD